MADGSASDSIVGESYDKMAQVYLDHVHQEMQHPSIMRSALQLLAELVGPGGVTLDAGCGPGHISAFLSSRGLAVSGIDISPDLIALAKTTFPKISFDVGSLNALPASDSSFDAVVSRHSIIHTHPDDLEPIVAEFARVMAPKGRLFLSFFTTNDASEHGESFDHAVCTAYQHDASVVSAMLAAQGFEEEARLVRQPRPAERQLPHAVLITGPFSTPP